MREDFGFPWEAVLPRLRSGILSTSDNNVHGEASFSPYKTYAHDLLASIYALSFFLLF
jgi:hypothetical protein